MMKELQGLLKLDLRTVAGKTLAENIAHRQILNEEVIGDQHGL